jgi:hypothetical protein
MYYLYFILSHVVEEEVHMGEKYLIVEDKDQLEKDQVIEIDLKEDSQKVTDKEVIALENLETA